MLLLPSCRAGSPFCLLTGWGPAVLAAMDSLATTAGAWGGKWWDSSSQSFPGGLEPLGRIGTEGHREMGLLATASERKGWAGVCFWGSEI